MANYRYATYAQLRVEFYKTYPEQRPSKRQSDYTAQGAFECFCEKLVALGLTSYTLANSAKL